jgi:hypothetical protein
VSGRDADPIMLLAVVVVVAEVLLSILVVRYVWRRTSTPAVGRTARVLVRATVFALLLSPTFVACGAGAPIPFPLIVAADVYFPGPACGQVRFFSTYNFLYVVLPTWFVVVLVQTIRNRPRTASAL